MKRILFILLFLLFFALHPASADDATPPLLMDAERLELAADGGYILAEGEAVLVYGELVLRAQKVLYREGKVVAEGEVTLTAGEDVLSAARVTVDLAPRTVTGEEIRGRLRGYFIRAEEINPTATGGMEFSAAGITRCDRSVPCYEFLAGRLVLEGRRVTVEHAWLVLGGRRLIPLPRLTLDLDRREEWPRLAGGYDERGLYLDLSFATDLRPSLGFVFGSTASTAHGLAVKIALPWRPHEKLKIEPTLAYTATTGFTPGLTLGGPSWNLGSGTLALEGYWTGETTDATGMISETALVLRWWRTTTEEEDELTLTFGRQEGFSSPFLSLRASSSRRLNARWGVALTGEYRLAPGHWEKAEMAGIRYFHCYYVRFGWDLLKGDLRLTGGIRF
ncbi:MAG: hypothetical protein GX493_06680 [Firmicutes bacterium]|nr:hypothetical protein [Bacillota bacterium]